MNMGKDKELEKEVIIIFAKNGRVKGPLATTLHRGEARMTYLRIENEIIIEYDDTEFSEALGNQVFTICQEYLNGRVAIDNPVSKENVEVVSDKTNPKKAIITATLPRDEFISGEAARMTLSIIMGAIENEDGKNGNSTIDSTGHNFGTITPDSSYEKLFGKKKAPKKAADPKADPKASAKADPKPDPKADPKASAKADPKSSDPKNDISSKIAGGAAWLGTPVDYDELERRIGRWR